MPKTKKPYRSKNRVVDVKVWLTIEQVKVLTNTAVYRGLFRGGPSDVSMKEQAQFVIDWYCSEFALDAAENLLQQDVVPLAYDVALLPSPD